MRAHSSTLSRRARLAEALDDLRERASAAAPGGNPNRAIPVRSAAVIEPRLAAMQCPHCGGSYRLLEHTRPVPGLRKVDVECRHCATPRAIWFSLQAAEGN
jgi:hypothetical protein